MGDVLQVSSPGPVGDPRRGTAQKYLQMVQADLDKQTKEFLKGRGKYEQTRANLKPVDPDIHNPQKYPNAFQPATRSLGAIGVIQIG